MSRVNIPIETCEPKVLRVWIAKLWEVRGANMSALQMFVSTYLSWFSKLVMIDGRIMDNTFKELEDINTLLIEKND